MRLDLSHQMVERYQRDGFLLVEGFLSAAELARWRALVGEALAERLRAKEQFERRKWRRLRPALALGSRSVFGEQGHAKLLEAARRRLGRLGTTLFPRGWAAAHMTNQGDPKLYYATVYQQVLGLGLEHAGLRKIALDRSIGELAARLAGVPAVRLYHDQSLVKVPGAPFTSWHFDGSFWSFEAQQGITLWIALDDMTQENGCLSYLPGSQRTASLARRTTIGTGFASAIDLYPEWRAIEPVNCPCPAGSAVFHNAFVAHSASANQTDRDRRAFACAFMPEGARFNGRQDVLPEHLFRRLRVGDPLNDEALHPLVGPRGQR